MEYIEKKNGEVWLVTEHDVEGRHKTYSYLGKEYNPYAYQVHRLETFADLSLRKVSQQEIARRIKEGSMPERNLVPLMEYHKY